MSIKNYGVFVLLMLLVQGMFYPYAFNDWLAAVFCGFLAAFFSAGLGYPIWRH